MSDDEGAVAEANALFYAAFEAKSLERMGEAWALSAPVTCIHPGWAPLLGREAVLASWVGIFSGTKSARFRLREPKIFVAGDTGWVILVEELALEQEGGERIHAQVLATNIFVREADGLFRMVHHHAAPAPDLGPVTDAPPPPRMLH
jgi:ketosteroid isomerase-like protein